MSVGPMQLIIIALVILVLFGRGRISEMMGDFGKGIKSFKEGMNEEPGSSAKPAARIEGPSQETKSASDVSSQATSPDRSDTSV